MICPKCGYKNRNNAGFCASCGMEMNAGDKSDFPHVDEALLPPTVMLLKDKKSLAKGRFIIIGKISEGGMGKIFLAQDLKMKCMVVIKQMIPIAENEKDLEYLSKRFKEEARLLFRLKHSSIPRVVDYFIENNNFYMIMEFIEGQNLLQYVSHKPDSRLSVDEAVDLMEKVCDILKYLHKQKPPIIHRDIKPGNIMINKEGEIILVDFGLARSLDKDKSSTAMVGTYGFSSPEHYTGKFLLSSDLYCLGATFHYLLSGESPRERLPFDFPPLARYRDDIPNDLQKLFDNLLDSDPKQRYSKVEEALRDIQIIKETDYPETLINWEKLLFESEDSSGTPAHKKGDQKEVIAEVPQPTPPIPVATPTPPLPSTPHDPTTDLAKEQKAVAPPIKEPKQEKTEEKIQEKQEEPEEKEREELKPDESTEEKRKERKEKRETGQLNYLKIALTILPFILILLVSAYYLYPLLSIHDKITEQPPPLPDLNMAEILIDVKPDNISGATIIITNNNDKNFGYQGKRIYKADELMKEGPASFMDNIIHIQVPQGSYSVLINKQGYKNISLESRNISKENPLKMEGFLEEIPPEIIISTNVEAEISVNNEKIGTASPEKPLTHKIKPGAQITVTASKSGYESAGEGPFTMKLEETKKISLELKKVYIPPTYPTYRPTTPIYRPPAYNPPPVYRPAPRDPARPE